jgi:hypothetical protein
MARGAKTQIQECKSRTNFTQLCRLLALICLASGSSASADEFAKVQCGTDIPKALIGQRSANERVVVTEKKYGKLGLKHLGADEISNDLSSINWLICGAEYIVLVDRHNIIGDAMPWPAHSKQAPAFSGICRRGGKEAPDVVVAILDGTRTGDALPALSAWKIDQQRAKFVKIPTEGLLCPRSGIYTVDGGL